MWIACKDKMPESGDVVLTYCAPNSLFPAVGTWWEGEGAIAAHWTINNRYWKKEDVSAWQPLPAPPSQEK